MEKVVSLFLGRVPHTTAAVIITVKNSAVLKDYPVLHQVLVKSIALNIQTCFTVCTDINRSVPMSVFKCCLCFQPAIEFPQDFKAVLADFTRVFNKFHSCSDVTKLSLCKSCWIYLMRIHQFDGHLDKETRDVKFALLSSKIQRAQRSSLENGPNSTGCEDFGAQTLASKSIDNSSRKAESHGTESVSVGGCSPKAFDNGSTTGSSSVSETLAEKEPREQASVDTSDSDSESKPIRRKKLRRAYKDEWLPQNGTLSESSSLVKRLSETEFMYLGKYPFQGTELGFKCGLCPQVCLFCFYKTSALWFNVIGHIRKWHMGNQKVRMQKHLERCIEVAPNRFQYGKYSFEKVDEKYQCGECGSLLPAGPPTGRKTRYIREHIIEKHENASRTYICEHCGLVYNTQEKLKAHKDTKHEAPSSQFPCSDCDKTFVSRSRALTHHKSVHQRIYKGKKFICEICGKESSTKHVIDDHVAFVHNGQKIKCKDCGKMFASQNALYTHRHSHTGKKFTCDVCGMEFTQHYSVARHKKTAHST